VVTGKIAPVKISVNAIAIKDRVDVYLRFMVGKLSIYNRYCGAN
jgi:hypothetical protein